MQTLYHIVRRHPVYFIVFLCCITAATFAICLNNKIDCFIKMNPLHTRWLDMFFIGVTYAGDGMFCLLVAGLVLLFRREYRLPVHIVIAYLTSGLVAQVMKTLWSAPRPRTIIDPSLYKNFLAGISGVGYSSFPSGHTTSAFALATLLVLYSGGRVRQLALLLGALAVGYSRIYLGQHFLPDVTAGALLGTGMALLAYRFIPVNLRKRTTGKTPETEELAEGPVYASTLAGQ